ncbi:MULTISPECIES: phosphoribosylanthranilate isomerase [unclassified Thioalkalivibrio]|uniref:phosphoribosylanthranilate isomerase n=1 Tax=unclassified Thioalkalivibrio TaxID=2621013 RepID=UPI0003698FC3|nr:MULTISPECIES: phosphoribosylanthranilate isomerase [unclassified Thioalkalivibrio]
MRYRVKICGITTPEQAEAAARAGADAIGLVFHPPSRRYVESDQAAEIAAALPPFVTTVGLFVDPDPAHVEQVLAGVRLDCLQFHGHESAAECTRFGYPYLRAVSMNEGGDPRPVMDAHPQAQGFLLDSHGAGRSGGSGHRFDWDTVPEALDRPWLLAGGLDEDSVREALEHLRPYGVDVSSGVESAPGIKDARRMEAFVKAVRQCEVNE